MWPEHRDAASIRQLRHVGTLLFLAILVLVVAHVVLLESIVRKQGLAAELSDRVSEQRADLVRIGRSAERILLLREQDVASPSLVAMNGDTIRKLGQAVAGRDAEIDRLLAALDGPLFPTTAAAADRRAYNRLVTTFLQRATELGSGDPSPVAATWTLPDLAVAPHGVLLSSLAHLDRIARDFAEGWRHMGFTVTIVSVCVVALLSAILLFRFYRPLARQALDDFLDLQASLSVRTRYFHQMSHELRTPLNVINGYAELLERDAERSGDRQTAARTASILEAGRQLTRRVNDILLLAELQSGVYVNNPIPLDIAEVADLVGAEMAPAAGIAVTVDDDRAAAIRVSVDRTALLTILTHLVRNALGHARERCTIRLSDAPGGTAVEIVDDGPGIDPSVIARILQPFHTTSNAVLETDTGPGVGLTIVSMLARLNGVALGIEAAEPRGTVVRLQFGGPVAAAAKTGNAS